MDWPFDPRTVVFMGALTTLLIDLLLLVVWRSLPPSLRPALRWWLTGVILLPAGFLLLSMRGLLPAALSIVVANTMIGLGLSANAIALRAFYRVPERRERLYVTTGVIAAVTLWFTYVVPSLHLRIVLVSGLLAVLAGSSARAIFRVDGPRGAIPTVTAAVFAFGTGLLVFRGVHELLEPLPVDALFDNTAVNILCFGLFGMLPVLSTVGFLLMCTERSQLELERAARLDYLTGICNRRAMEDLAQRALAAARRHGTPLALMIIDVDHFKRINDQLGHQGGDLALVEAVTRIRDALRSEDLVGRLGGEEFVVVMPNTDAQSAIAAGERIRTAFSGRAMAIHGQAIPVTVSVGIAVMQPEDQQFSQLLRRADHAMYAAKAAGRNRVMLDATHLP